MKNLTATLSRLTVACTGLLALASCNRAEYATFPRSAAYLGSTPVARQRPATAPATPKPAPAVLAAPVVAGAPAAPNVAPALAAAPAAPAPMEAAAPVAAPAVVAAAPAAAAPVARPMAPKLNLVQRLALHKITRKLDKLASQAPQLRQRDASAARGGLDSNLRSALLFGLIGLVLLLFSGVSNIFAIIGTILVIIGLIFLILWVLDQA